MRMYTLIHYFTMDRNVDVTFCILLDLATLFEAAKATVNRVLPVPFDMDCRQVSRSTGRDLLMQRFHTNPKTAYPNHP